MLYIVIYYSKYVLRFEIKFCAVHIHIEYYKQLIFDKFEQKFDNPQIHICIKIKILLIFTTSLLFINLFYIYLVNFSFAIVK